MMTYADIESRRESNRRQSCRINLKGSVWFDDDGKAPAIEEYYWTAIADGGAVEIDDVQQWCPKYKRFLSVLNELPDHISALIDADAQRELRGAL